MAQSIVVPSGDRLEFPDGMPDSEIEKAIHAEYPDLAPKPSLMSRAGAALKPAEREPMPSAADTINAGWTSPPEERLSVPGSVMDKVPVSRLPVTPPPSIESEGSFTAASRKLRTNQDAAAVSAERAAMPSATAIQPGIPSAGDFAKAVKVGMTDIGTIAGKGLRYLGAEDFGSLLQSAGQRQAKETQRGMTPAGQMAMDAPIVTDEIEWGETPMASASLQALRSAPSMIAALPFGGVAAKGIESAGGATLKALAAHPGIIGRIASLAPTAIGAGGAEGIQAALMNAAQTETEIMELPIQQLRGSPKFQELMAQADPAIPLAQRERQVRAAIAKLASDEVARRTFVSTGGIGILTGGGAQGVLLRQMQGKGAKTILGAAGKGTVEEAIQEAPQSGAEQYIQNVATQNYVDPTASASQGVISAGLSGGIVGGLTGGVMGAGGRILSGPPGQEKAPSPRAELDAILSSDKPVAEILAAQEAPAAAPQATPQAPLQPAAFGWPDTKTPAVATLPDGQVITGQIAGIQDSDGQPMARFVGADGQVWMIQPGEADIKPAPAGDGTRAAPVQAETAEHVKIAEQAVNTDPSEAQNEAGNYQLGHLAIQGLDIAIENPAGSVRSGVDKAGKPWANTLNHTYGYIKGATAADGDKLDAFIGPDPQSQQVFVIDQIDPDTGRYDEGKVMLGFNSMDEARAAYLSNYDADWRGLGDITPMVMPAFKAWIAKGETHKPLAYDQKAAIAERKTAADTQKAGEAYAAEREKAVAAIGEDQVAAIEDQVADQNAGQPTIELYRAIATALKAEAARQATQPAVQPAAQVIAAVPRSAPTVEPAKPKTPSNAAITYTRANLKIEEDGEIIITKGEEVTITHAKAEKMLAEKMNLRDRLLRFVECVHG